MQDEHYLTQKISERIKAARLATTISGNAMAEKLGIPQSTYSQYETGRRMIPLSKLLKLSELLQVRYIWLLTGEKPITAPLDRNLEDQINQLLSSDHQIISVLPNISQTDIAMVDLKLLFKILHKLANTNFSSLVELEPAVIDIYNAIVSSESDLSKHESLLNFALKSLQAGTTKNLNRAFCD